MLYITVVLVLLKQLELFGYIKNAKTIILQGNELKIF